MDTKTRILDAAQELFAEHGLEKTSLRLISAKAGVNVAAVNYHFGSKENLLREIFIRLITPLDAQRDRLLAVAMDRGRDPSAQDLVRAFLIPWFEFKRHYPEFISIFGQFYARKDKTDSQFRDLIRESARDAYARFTRFAAAALPRVPSEELLMRINLAVATAASVLVNNWLIESLADLSGIKITDDVLLSHVEELIESGLAKGNQP